MKARPRRAAAVLAAGVALAAGAATDAGAVHWPMFGGDNGRSGYQPVDEGALPARFLYRDAADNVQTSIVTTAGGGAQFQRLAYGHRTLQSNGSPDESFIRVRRLVQGTSVANIDIDSEAPVDPPGSAAPVNDADTFGPDGGVTPMDASTSAGLRELYVVHNDENNPETTVPGDNLPNDTLDDIALAEINLADNTKEQDIPLPGTNGYTIRSSPVLTGDLGGGNREIYFIASRTVTVNDQQTQDERLFKVSITRNANDPDGISVTNSGKDINANPDASPALGRFKDPDSGVESTYVIVPLRTGVTTFRTNNLNPDAGQGPRAENIGAPFYTPSIPINSDGTTPLTSQTPFFYAASLQSGNTVVYKLQQDTSNVNDPNKLRTFTFTNTTSGGPTLAGAPAPALALKQETGEPGRVVVSTARNVYSLDSENLKAPAPKLLATDITDAQSADIGFSNTTAAITGDVGFITNNDGDQFAFNPVNMVRAAVDASGFAPNEESLNSTRALGQPSISRGIVQFGADNGIFVYGTKETATVAPAVAFTSPPEGASISGSAAPISVTATDNRAVEKVVFTRGSTVIGEDALPDGDAMSNYSTTLNTTTLPEGPLKVTATATDVSGNTTAVDRTFNVNNLDDPDPAFTCAPECDPGKPQSTGTEFTFDASTSKSSTAENPGPLTYAWDFGDGTRLEASSGRKVVKHSYAKAGSYTVTLTVSDRGGPASTSKQVAISNRPPVAGFSITPSPAMTGQLVKFNASATKDPDGSVTNYAWDLDGNGSFEVTGASPTTERSYDAPGTYAVSLRVTDDSGATTLVTEQLRVNAAPGSTTNANPAASFTVNPNPATTGQQVTFDASASRDAEGPIAKYEWDLDGNGTFETDTGNVARTTRTYTVPEVVNVRLKVTDAGGASAAAVRQLIVEAGSTRACGGNAPRCSATVTYSVSPKRDRRKPYRFTARGRITPPARVDRGDACQGRVSLVTKRGETTISTVRKQVRTSCRFRVVVSFKNARRFGKATKLRFQAIFQGNKVLNPRRGKVLSARIR